MTTLLDLVTNPECHGDVDTLEVSWVKTDGWTFRHQIGLAKLLNKHRVKKLIFLPNIKPVGKYHLDLVAGDNQEDGKFVPIHYLRSVEIDTQQFCSFMTTFVEWSRASSVIYKIGEQFEHPQTQAAWYCSDYPGHLKSNFSLRKMTFLYKGKLTCPSKQIYRQDVQTVQAALRRNLLAFQKCQKAVIILIGLKKPKTVQSLDRDVFGMVIDMVWSNKGRRVWTEGEQCEELK
jgi:hypothetical protein